MLYVEFLYTCTSNLFVETRRLKHLHVRLGALVEGVAMAEIGEPPASSTVNLLWNMLRARRKSAQCDAPTSVLPRKISATSPAMNNVNGMQLAMSSICKQCLV